MADIETMSDTPTVADLPSQPLPDSSLSHKEVEEQKVQDDATAPSDPSPTSLSTTEESKIDDSITPPHPSDVIYNDSSDSEDDVSPSFSPPFLPPPTSTASAPHPPFHSLEEDIELEEKQDREYAVPHLSSISFDTPVSSAPATPSVVTPSNLPYPFTCDPTIILIPDKHQFARSHLPLLYPKLTLILAATTTPLHVRLDALSACVDLTRDPLHLPHLISEGVVDELLLNTGWADEEVRRLSAKALYHLVERREGREYTLDQGLIARIPNLLIDQCADVRVLGCEVLERVVRVEVGVLLGVPQSAAAGDAASVLTFLIRRFQQDTQPRVQIHLLRCIRLALRKKDGLIIARYNGFTRILHKAIQLLKGPPVGLLEEMGRVLAAVAGEEEGKAEMVEEQLQVPLLEWMQHQDVGVKLSAATALTHATGGIAMKHAVVTAGGIDICVARILTLETDTAALTMQLQLLTNLMETAKAKAQLKAHAELQVRVQSLSKSAKKEEASLARSAQSVMLKYKQWES